MSQKYASKNKINLMALKSSLFCTRGIHFKFLMIPRTQHTLIFLLPHGLFLARSLQFSLKKIFIWLCQVLVAARELLVTARGI